MGRGNLRSVNSSVGGSLNTLHDVPGQARSRQVPPRPHTRDWVEPRPPKRQKIGIHTSSHFALINPASDEQSLEGDEDSSSRTEPFAKSNGTRSRGHGSLVGAEQEELRSLDRFASTETPRKRRKRSRSSPLGTRAARSGAERRNMHSPHAGFAPASEQDDEVDVPEKLGNPKDKTMPGAFYPGEMFAGLASANINPKHHKATRRSMMKIFDNFSEDELAGSGQETERQAKRPKQSGINPTKPGRSLRSEREPPIHIKGAERTIAAGLHVQSAACLRDYVDFPASEGGTCVLKLGVVTTLLRPESSGPDWLVVNLLKINKIFHCQESPVVLIKQSASQYGGDLALKFSGTDDTRRFVAWAKEGTETRGMMLTLKLDEWPRTPVALEEVFQKRIEDARNKQAQLARVKSDDVKLLEHKDNQRREQQHLAGMSDSKTRRSLRSQMRTEERLQDSGSSPNLGTTPKGASDNPFSRRRGLRDRRSGGIFETLEDDLPPLQRWTEKNTDWAKDWRVPLSFNRTTVDKDDILRLDEGQFLNDNIITFYLKYLHEELRKQNERTAGRVYFFNSFFYDKLKASKGRDINYDGVRNWTSKVDLFKYDYIVVPVNEYAHWWVAIICNAKKLLPEDEEILEHTDDNQPGKGLHPGKNDDRQVDKMASPKSRANITSSMSQVTLDDGKSDGRAQAEKSGEQGLVSLESVVVDHASLKTDPETGVTSISPQEERRAGKRYSGGPLKKYSPDEPRIITLDSLGNNHSPACSNLRAYLTQEIKEKKQIEIDNPGPLGMTAKNIPLQENFCDCGVYLLGYMQEFVKGPGNFVRHILQREELRWEVDAPALRNDLRNLIFNLQRQHQDKEEALQRRRKVKESPLKLSDGPPEQSGLIRELSRPLTEPTSGASPTPAAVITRTAASVPIESSGPLQSIPSTPTREAPRRAGEHDAIGIENRIINDQRDARNDGHVSKLGSPHGLDHIRGDGFLPRDTGVSRRGSSDQVILSIEIPDDALKAPPGRAVEDLTRTPDPSNLDWEEINFLERIPTSSPSSGSHMTPGSSRLNPLTTTTPVTRRHVVLDVDKPPLAEEAAGNREGRSSRRTKRQENGEPKYRQTHEQLQRSPYFASSNPSLALGSSSPVDRPRQHQRATGHSPASRKGSIVDLTD